jgi:hypothetical protein
MLHLVRQRLMAGRTMLINQTRGFLVKYGIVFSIHVAEFKRGVRPQLAKDGNHLPG